MIERRNVVGGVSGDGKSLRGLVTPFNVWTEIGDKRHNGFDERIAPGTFTKTLSERDVVLLDAHDTSKPMARTSITDGPGSLKLAQVEGRGLEADAEPTDTSYARDVLVNAKAGVTRGMSFGFEVIKDSWTDDAGNPSDSQRGTKRTIHEVRLHEVTTTAFPAYGTTELSARDSVNAARGVAEERAAVASYADVNTCAECGAESQYGAFCTGCGGSMKEPGASAAEFCSSCGSKLSGQDGDGDSDADDQEISRSTEPVDTTPEASDDAEYREWLAHAMAEYLRTR